MPVTRIPTRVKALVEKIEPLANWLKQNKPECKTIHLAHKDWLFLLQAKIEDIRSAGFNVTSENGVTFGRFTLKPTVQTVEKQTENK
jgi:hypothetical protein